MAFRTSHNPPSPELLELMDKMGFIVMDEAFDMWKKRRRSLTIILIGMSGTNGILRSDSSRSKPSECNYLEHW